MSTDDTKGISVIAEELDVQKRTVDVGGVRISKAVHEREETINEPLRQTRVTVERVVIDQIVETAPAVRREGDTMIIPVVEEFLVVEKRLLLKEEIRVTTQSIEVREPQRVKLRREEVVVERLQPQERKE